MIPKAKTMMTDNDRIAARRQGAEMVVESYSPEDREKMLVHLVEELKAIGITRVTEDLIRLLWGVESITLDFIATNIQFTCVNPACGYASFSHAAAGVDMLGVVLLALEDRVGNLL